MVAWSWWVGQPMGLLGLQLLGLIACGAIAIIGRDEGLRTSPLLGSAKAAPWRWCSRGHHPTQPPGANHLKCQQGLYQPHAHHPRQ